MKEIDYSIAGSKEFLNKVSGYFSGIDSICVELEEELKALAEEKESLENSESYTASALKRKAMIGEELNTVEKALQSAKEERNKIQEKYWSEIAKEADGLYSHYGKQISEQLNDTENEIDDLLIEAKEKVSEIKKVMEKRNSLFRSQVADPVNQIVKRNSKTKSNVLSFYSSSKVADIERRLEKILAKYPK